MPVSGSMPQHAPRTPWENVGSGISSIGTKVPWAAAPSTSGKGAGTGAGLGASFFAALSVSITSGGTAKNQHREKAVIKVASASTTYIANWDGVYMYSSMPGTVVMPLPVPFIPSSMAIMPATPLMEQLRRNGFMP